MVQITVVIAGEAANPSGHRRTFEKVLPLPPFLRQTEICDLHPCHEKRATTHSKYSKQTGKCFLGHLYTHRVVDIVVSIEIASFSRQHVNVHMLWRGQRKASINLYAIEKRRIL